MRTRLLLRRRRPNTAAAPLKQAPQHCQTVNRRSPLVPKSSEANLEVGLVNLFLACFFNEAYAEQVPSVRCRCWLGGRKGIWPVKNRVVGYWHSYLSGARCRLAYGPADATATHCLLLQ